MLDIIEIQKLLPHRYPFLLVDRVEEIREGEFIRGLKNVTANEPFFEGHFPGHPIMPGVLMIEALAQLGGILAIKSSGEGEKLTYFMGVDKVKFRKPVVPGDTLILEIETIKRRGDIWSSKGKALVGDVVVCEAELKAMIKDRD